MSVFYYSFLMYDDGNSIFCSVSEESGRKFWQVFNNPGMMGERRKSIIFTREELDCMRTDHAGDKKIEDCV